MKTPILAPPAALTVSVIGAGRLGRVMARALRAADVEVEGPTGRNVVPGTADVALLCVPDAEIARAAAAVRGTARFVGHVSGATPVAGGDVDFGLHPLRSFSGREGADAFGGVGCAIAAVSPDALAVAFDITGRLGGTPFPIDDAQRAGYHAAASIASNFLVTLMAAAEEVAQTAGIPAEDARAMLAPLVRGTVENWASLGPRAALTGPVARGDHDTVARQRAAIAADAPDLLPLFDTLVTATRALAEKGRASA